MFRWYHSSEKRRQLFNLCTLEQIMVKIDQYQEFEKQKLEIYYNKYRSCLGFKFDHFALHGVWLEVRYYTVKLTRAKLPANAGNFSRGLHVKRLHTQFTCATCSIRANTGKFTPVHAASASRRLHANCLQPHVNLPEHNGYFTGTFTCGTHANLPATCMQNCLLLQAIIHAIGWQTYLQLQAICYHTANKFTCKLQVS